MDRTDDSVEALQTTLQNAFAVLGRRPDVVSSISDERKYEKRIRELESELDAARKELEATRGTLNSTSDKLEHIAREYINTAKSLKSSQQTLAETQAEVQAKQEELKMAKTEIDSLKDEMKTLKESFAAAKEELGQKEKLNAQLSDEHKKLKIEFENTRKNQQKTIHDLEKDLQAFKESFTKFAKESNDQADKLIRQQVSTSYISGTVIRKLLAKISFSQWATFALRNVIARVKKELTLSQSKCASLSTELDKTRKNLHVTDSKLKEFKWKRDTAVSVGCAAFPQTREKTTMTVEIKPRRDAALTMNRGSTTELDEIAKLRWEIDRQQKQFARHREDKAAVVAYMEMEVGRLSDEIAKEKRKRNEAEKSRDDVIRELSMVQSVIGKQNSSIAVLNDDYNKAELFVQTRIQAQLEAAATDIQKSLNQSSNLLLRKNNESKARDFFAKWRRYAHDKRHALIEASTQHKDRSPLTSNTIFATMMMNQSQRQLVIRFLWKWRESAAAMKKERIAQENFKEFRNFGAHSYQPTLASTPSQTEDVVLHSRHGKKQRMFLKGKNGEVEGLDEQPMLFDADLINKRLEKLRLAHYAVLAESERKTIFQQIMIEDTISANKTLANCWYRWRSKFETRQRVADCANEEVMKYRLHVASLSRDAESTALLLEQANSKVTTFQSSMDQLRSALTQSNSINQLLSDQNKSLRAEIAKFQH